MKGKTFPVVDRIPMADLEKLGLTREEVSEPLPSIGMYPKRVKAMWTGEKRRPKKGEWFLSGNPIEAYRAPNDLSMVYHIARLVKVRTETVEIIEE